MNVSRWPLAVAASLSAALALLPAGCARPPVHRYFQPSASQIGPYPNSYGEAVLPHGGLIVVQGDDLAYGDVRGRGRDVINGATRGQSTITISETLRKVIKGVKVENRGFPGDTLAAGAARWADRRRPDLLILAYGSGDNAAHTPGQAFITQYTAMVQAAQAAGTAVFIVVPPNLSKPVLEADLAPYQAIARAVSTSTGATLFEASVAVTRIKAGVPKDSALTPAIYQAVAADMVPYIKIIPAPKPG